MAEQANDNRQVRGSNPLRSTIWVGNLAARVADCKSVTRETSVVRVHPGPPICSHSQIGEDVGLSSRRWWVQIPLGVPSYASSLAAGHPALTRGVKVQPFLACHMQMCWNWYTGWLEVPVPQKGVRVRAPPSVPYADVAQLADAASSNLAFLWVQVPSSVPYAGIAQLARAPAFQAGGYGFKSRYPLHVTVAQAARASDCGSEGCGFEFRQSPHMGR